MWGYIHQLFSSLLYSLNLLQAQSHRNLLHIGQEIYAQLTRSSFLELGLSTNPSYNHFHLALQVSTYTKHKAFAIT
jgi:hypothetical protein